MVLASLSATTVVQNEAESKAYTQANDPAFFIFIIRFYCGSSRFKLLSSVKNLHGYT